jgi:hypothetical protein
MKLSDLKQDNTITVEFLDPHTKESFSPKVTFELRYINSRFMKNEHLKSQRKILELMQDEKNLTDEKALKPELIEDVTKAYLSQLIVSWKNIEDFKKVTDEAKLTLIQDTDILNFVMENCNDLGKFRS